ncbi:major facilitator superfamily domain-containing protein [Mariannaea sp. PMI_226]|nr:major facilitator superfamily domain-containing protein [Mariannaea sp. PMI_226]
MSSTTSIHQMEDLVSVLRPKGTRTTTALLQNPLGQLSHEEIIANADAFVDANGLIDHRDVFRKGALLAKVYNSKTGFENLNQLTEDEKCLIRLEKEHRWTSQPSMLYKLCAVCAGCAIVQGMDQTVINGAQEFYFDEFNVDSPTVKGLVNGAPYIAAAVVGCWLNAPLNKHIGRRGTIAFSCFVAFITAIWQAASRHWISLLIARLFLGLAVGTKSSTTPVYTAECAPKDIRGALTMMWQMWTAFGIMLGFLSGIVFQSTTIFGEYTQWRWMIGSTALPPLIVGLLVYTLPESPRWYMDKGNFKMAFESLISLRGNELQASRDVFLAFKFLQVEENTNKGHNIIGEIFSIRRNWRAAQSAWFCMFMQQFCGSELKHIFLDPKLTKTDSSFLVVNVIAYYSTEIFKMAGYSRSRALFASLGGGAINWVFALPAVWTIDTFGRRNLLLLTFPLMAICLFWTGFSLRIEDEETRVPLLATSMYIFMALYSPGMGPVPFTYSAEAFPLHIRSLGMASATSLTWTFNFLLSFTWPRMMASFGGQNAFFWYGTWNLIGWTFAYFLLPETKAMTLEELDLVFSVRNRDHARYYTQRLRWYFKRLIGRRLAPMPPLYQIETDSTEFSIRPEVDEA